jgi:hypothetical protein
LTVKTLLPDLEVDKVPVEYLLPSNPFSPTHTKIIIRSDLDIFHKLTFYTLHNLENKG